MPELARAATALLVAFAAGRARAADADDLAALVDPFIGTGKATGAVTGAPGGGDAGNTFPGATLPFGMIAWSPETTNAFTPALNQAGSYVYADTSIRGFSLTHLSGPGCPVYGNIPIMPAVAPPTRSPAAHPTDRLATFSHAREQASPGAYGVDLASAGIRVDLAVTARTGVGRFTFPPVREATILVDTGDSAAGRTDKGSFDGAIAIVGDRWITGFATGGKFCSTQDRYTVYFAAEFDRPFAAVGTWSGDDLGPGARAARGRRAGAWVTFDATAARAVHVAVAVSYVSVEGALANLAAERRGFDLDGVRAAGRDAWNRALGRARVGGGTETARRIFTTALYHALLHPNVFSDVDGRYVGFDRRVHHADGYTAYANFSGWDIYRCQVQLLALLFPREAADMARSLVDAAETGGAAPRWSAANSETGVMVGDPAAAIIAGIRAFGATTFPAGRALAALVRAADRPGTRAQDVENRPGLAAHLARGFIPLFTADVWGPAATTLEYATADFAIATLAGALGDARTRARYMRRAQSWQQLFDPRAGLIRPRLPSGAFAPDFETDRARPVAPNADSGRDHGQLGFVEGNAWQYTWMVPFNLAGLIRAMGGRAPAIAALDAFFAELNAGTLRPRFYMGNEPQFAAPWAYTFAGAPEKTQAVVHQILTTLFVDEPAGLPGNDDLGATSAWYVWAALGLYPAIPGAGGLVLGAPLFPSATVMVGGVHPLEISVGGAPGGSAAAPTVRAVTLDGRPHPSTWLPVTAIRAGGKLAFTVGPPEAGRGAWGTRAQDAPPSFGEGSAPAIGFLERPSFLALAPGASAEIPFALRPLTDRTTVRWSALAPHPLEISPAAGVVALTGGNDGRAVVRLSAPAATPRGCAAVEFRFEPAAGGAPPGAAAIPGAVLELAIGDETLAPYMNHKGVSRDAVRAEAEFDRTGASYSAEALYKADLAPGAAVARGGLTFSWPRGCALDHVVADGQRVELRATGRIGFLGAAEGAPAGARGTVVVTYADGETQRFALGLSDWTLAGGKAAPGFGNEIVATLPYHNRRRDRVDEKTYVFFAAIDLPAGKVARSVTLPAAAESTPARIHIFAISSASER
jgi:predicted alpha-1,2-mannosidase